MKDGDGDEADAKEDRHDAPAPVVRQQERREEGKAPGQNLLVTQSLRPEDSRADGRRHRNERQRQRPQRNGSDRYQADQRGCVHRTDPSGSHLCGSHFNGSRLGHVDLVGSIRVYVQAHRAETREPEA